MYAQLTDVLTEMVVAGVFPKRSGNDQGTGGRGGAPRIGDGLIVLDKSATISFASPNARSAFRRLGIAIDIEGQPLADLVSRLNRRGVPVDDTLALVANGRIQGTAEVEGSSAAVTLRSIPLVRDSAAFGTIVMVRDVSDLRRREKALLGKDATIREIHHRVKNNLQTVASLLRLQARRLGDPTAQAALAEAVRRVGTIAVVHDLLAHDPGEVVNFNDVAMRVVGLTIETGAPITANYSIEKNFGELPSDKATPLALVLAELVANAIEHAGANRNEVAFKISCQRTMSGLEIEVTDDGPGIELPVDTSKGLGLSIVTTLVRDELKGEIEFGHEDPHGTRVRIEIPLITS
jgi:two-component sensor histidine kinase